MSRSVHLQLCSQPCVGQNLRTCEYFTEEGPDNIGTGKVVYSQPFVLVTLKSGSRQEEGLRCSAFAWLLPVPTGDISEITYDAPWPTPKLHSETRIGFKTRKSAFWSSFCCNMTSTVSEVVHSAGKVHYVNSYKPAALSAP